ncbi:MAG: DUF6142 family protein [Dorea sp.]
MIIRKKGKNTEEARAKALAKEREKRRKTMIRTKYGQTPLKHAKKGIKSCAYSSISSFLLLLLLSSSFVTNGEVSLAMGIIGIIAMALAIGGFAAGIRGFKERDKNYITCKVGVGWSGLLVFGMCAIFIRGLF